MVSKAQRKILERLGEGEVVILIIGRDTHMFWSAHISDWKNPRTDSIFSLVDKRYIESYNSDWRGRDYRITQKGRDYLEATNE